MQSWSENNARGHSGGGGQGSCGLMAANEEDFVTIGGLQGLFFFTFTFFCRNQSGLESTCGDIVCESRQSAATTLPAAIHERLSHAIKEVGVAMVTWRSKGSAPVRLTHRPIVTVGSTHRKGRVWGMGAGAILPDLSLFVAVKIPLAASRRGSGSPLLTPH